MYLVAPLVLLENCTISFFLQKITLEFNIKLEDLLKNLKTVHLRIGNVLWNHWGFG